MYASRIFQTSDDVGNKTLTFKVVKLRFIAKLSLKPLSVFSRAAMKRFFLAGFQKLLIISFKTLLIFAADATLLFSSWSDLADEKFRLQPSQFAQWIIRPSNWINNEWFPLNQDPSACTSLTITWFTKKDKRFSEIPEIYYMNISLLVIYQQILLLNDGSVRFARNWYVRNKRYTNRDHVDIWIQTNCSISLQPIHGSHTSTESGHSSFE